MSITIKSNTDTILELPGLTGTLGPGKTAVVQAMTPDLLRAVDLGLLLVPSGAEPPRGCRRWCSTTATRTSCL